MCRCRSIGNRKGYMTGMDVKTARDTRLSPVSRTETNMRLYCTVVWAEVRA